MAEPGSTSAAVLNVACNAGSCLLSRREKSSKPKTLKPGTPLPLNPKPLNPSTLSSLTPKLSGARHATKEILRQGPREDGRVC